MTARRGPEIRHGRIHEIVAHDSGDPAARLFAAWCAGAISKPILWIIGGRAGELCPHGLFGLMDPHALVLVRPRNAIDALWSAEAALRSDAVGTVVLETEHPLDLRESRRLQLAAETGGTLGFFLGPNSGNTACETRWRCEALPGSDGTATPFAWKQLKNKKGSIGQWEAVRDEATGRMRVAPVSGGGADAEARPRSGPALRRGTGGEERLAALLAQSGSTGGGIVTGHGAR